MRKIVKGTTLSQDSIVLEEEEVELFLQFQKFYDDYKSGIVQKKLAKKISNFVQPTSSEEAA